jgi:hypothetical protein
MSGVARFPYGASFDGPITANSFNLPAGSITNALIASDAGLDADKLEHRQVARHAPGGTAASGTFPLATVYGATARRVSARAGSIAIAVGSATVTVDIKKNGTSILTGGTPVTFNSSNVARTMVDLAVTTTTAAVGDFFEAVLVATASGGTIPTGFIVELQFDEDAG